MRRAPMLALLLAAAPFCSAAEVGGSWVTSQERPGGALTEMQFTFEQAGDTFIGSVTTAMGAEKIVRGKIDGRTVQFETVMEFFGQERRAKWEGKLEGDHLALTSAAGREVVAVRGESATLRALADADARRLKLPLPKLTALPPGGFALIPPPMGWSSGPASDDKLIRQIAGTLISTGLRDAGYLYAITGDGWQGVRDASGVLHPNAGFPDMKALGAYVHSKGLKFGIYSSPGPQTCGGFEGSYGYEELDARTFAGWGVDLVIYDWCSASRVFPMAGHQRVFLKFAQALRATGRPIALHAAATGWASLEGDWAELAGAIGWTGPHLLEVAAAGLTPDQERAHLTLRAMMGAPLVTGGRSVGATPPESLAVLSNRDVIAIDQDKLGRPATRVSKNGGVEVWAKALSGGNWAIAVFNRSAEERQMAASRNLVPGAADLSLRDVWAGKEIGKFSRVEAKVPARGVVLLLARRRAAANSR